MSKLRITVLVEDSAGKAGLIAEHGLALHVESGGVSGLFDTGQTDAVVKNAETLGIDLAALSWIVLSHGHYDHTGGLRSVLDVARNATLFAHPDVFRAKYVKGGVRKWRSAGIRITAQEAEREGVTLHLSSEPAEVAADVVMTGEIPRNTDFESVSARFFLDKNGEKTPDLFPDDQALVLESEQGAVVLLGCAHSGVVNILERVSEIVCDKRIYAVIGGMHLGGAPDERLRKTVEAFRALDIPRIGLAHCTGKKAVAAFFDAFGDRCFLCPAGSVIDF